MPDVDPRNGGWKAWSSLAGRAPFTTVTAHTGRLGKRPISRYAPLGDTGTHWYFEAPDEPLRQGKNALGPGIDVKGAGVNDSHGGMVVAPGSRHPTGGLYHWAEGLGPDEVGFAPLPEFIARLLRPEQSVFDGGQSSPDPRQEHRRQVIISSRREMHAEAEARLSALAAMGPDSGRNDVLNALAYWFGRRLAYFPGSEEQVRQWLMEACEANGLADDLTSGGQLQVERTIESGLSAGKADPVVLQSRRSYRQERSRLVQRSCMSTAKAYDVTEQGNAERLYEALGGNIHYVPEAPKTRQWLLFRRGRWRWATEFEIDQHLVSRIEAIHDLEIDALDQTPQGRRLAPEELRKWREELASWRRRSGKDSTIRGSLNRLKAHKGVSVGYERLDDDPCLVGARNGVLDLEGSRIHLHKDRQDLLVTKSLGPLTGRKPGARCSWRSWSGSSPMER